jgi:hypothetical protein
MSGASTGNGRADAYAALLVRLIVTVVTYLIGHDYPRAQMVMKRLPRTWGPALGSLLATGE